MSNKLRPWPTDAPPIKAHHVTLIARVGGEYRWACNVGEKREILRDVKRGPIVLVWTGQYSSHAFEVSLAEARAWFDGRGS